ncbi:FAD-dependent monooxygenase [Rhizobium sp. PAMB 3182]
MIPTRAEVAVIGGGPVGLTAASLLGRLGINCVLFERNQTTAFHPKGHVVNTRTMEIFRMMGMADGVDAEALPLERHAGIGFVTSLLGDEIGAIKTRSDPEWARVERSQSPMLKRSCPQDRLEPVIRKHAEGFECVSLNFGCNVIGIEQQDEAVTLRWEDAGGRSGSTQAKYVIAADGTRSEARDAVGVGISGESMGQQIGIYFHADLWEYVKDRPYLLNWIYNSKTSGVLISLDGRHRWTYNFGYADNETRHDFSEERCLDILHAVIGTDDIEIEIKNIMPWRMQARIVDAMSSGRVFFAGDAAHPLPPTGGQGVNTGVADVHNLAWKLALVLKGLAPESLLETYDTERRPVAKFNVEQSARNARAMEKKGLSGMLFNDNKLLSKLEGPAGAANRAKLAEGIPEQRAHFDYPGQTFGFRYESSLVTGDGTPAPPVEVETYTPTARPGHRAPHIPAHFDGRDISIIDLFDLGSFTLLAGPKGQAWKAALEDVDGKTLPKVNAYQLGNDLDVELDLDAWKELYGVSDEGAVLIRPDGHVAWRCSQGGDTEALIAALRRSIGQNSKSGDEIVARKTVLNAAS